MKIALISCTAKKASKPTIAKEMYVSPLFKGAYRYAQSLNVDKIYILSAKYGLVDENMEIAPYNKTLNKMSVSEIKIWSNQVFERLKTECDIKNDEFVILAGINYRKYLIGNLSHYSIPLKGKKLGEQLQFYKNLSK